jgi:hypothetical protein
VGRVEEAAVVGRAAGARPAVQEDRRLAVRLAAGLPVHDMRRIEGKLAPVVGLDRRKEVVGAHRGSRLGILSEAQTL